VRRHTDLTVALALTVVAAAAAHLPSTAPELRAPLALPLVLALPGYALAAAIFGDDLPGVFERVVVSIGLSLAATMATGLMLHLSPFGLTARSWAVALPLVTAAALAAARFRRHGPPTRRAVSLRRRPRPSQLALVIAGSILAAAALAVARTPLAAPHADGYTALWLVKDKRSAQLRVGVRSAELEATTYRLRIRLDGRALPTRWFRLRPGAAWEQTLPHGEWAAASLYRGGERATYRRVRLIDPSRAGRAPARGGS
jgi:uncharacterized membrane protein